ncbi:hypothetical protein Taro_033563 [Colocasia esculenta]|uniref:Uncharacterized protein n=1 Tax=Colocasia esculenta TaxID=4460 RepID=A0A843VVL0_COLES|nr:hypothetical protein [Colocasia esculenta]
MSSSQHGVPDMGSIFVYACIVLCGSVTTKAATKYFSADSKDYDFVYVFFFGDVFKYGEVVNCRKKRVYFQIPEGFFRRSDEQLSPSGWMEGGKDIGFLLGSGDPLTYEHSWADQSLLLRASGSFPTELVTCEAHPFSFQDLKWQTEGIGEEVEMSRERMLRIG